MTCQEARQLLGGYLDGELDLRTHLDMERHVAECTACGRALESQRVLGAGLRAEALYYRAPAGLERRVRQAMRQAQPRSPLSSRRWFAIAASAAAAGLAGWTLRPLWRRAPAEEALSAQVLASHVRSLMAEHLTDVPSSDQHTVKPWFSGKLDFSPPVTDFSSRGFVLVGGRLDYLAGRAVAAVVYRRRQHVINLFTWPQPGAGDLPVQAETRQGYHLLRWTKAGIAHWLISDLNEKELREFAGLLQ